MPHSLQWLGPLLAGQFSDQRVKLIVSTLGKCEKYWSGRCFQVLKEEKANILKIGKVSTFQRDVMINEILRRSQKQIDKSFDLTQKLTDPHANRSNPLYISILVNEMKHFGGYQAAHSDVELLSNFVDEMLQNTNVPQLLDIIFRRLERKFVLPPLKQRYSLGTCVQNNLKLSTGNVTRKVKHGCKCSR